MKKIEACIRPEKMDTVRDALARKGVVGLTITEVSGRGQQGGITLQWRAGVYRVELLPKMKLEVVVDDEEVDTVVDTICNWAKTGKEGDGKIFILPVDNAVRVRTGEKGLPVLQARTPEVLTQS